MFSITLTNGEILKSHLFTREKITQSVLLFIGAIEVLVHTTQTDDNFVTLQKVELTVSKSCGTS